MPQLNSSLSNRPMSSTGSAAMDSRRSRGNAPPLAFTTSAVSPRPPPPSHEPPPTHAPSLRRAPSSSGNTPHGTSSWSGSAASGSTPAEALSMHIAVLEAQLKSTMQKLHREKVDNRVSSLGMVSMMSRLISVVYTETRTPHSELTCAVSSGSLTRDSRSSSSSPRCGRNAFKAATGFGARLPAPCLH